MIIIWAGLKSELFSIYCLGACWSFSATGAIEGINKIVTGSLTSLSEQELVDCDRSYNDGCEGGLMDYAYQFVVKNKGIDTEEDYPYLSRDATCNKNKVNNLYFVFVFCPTCLMFVYITVIPVLYMYSRPQCFHLKIYRKLYSQLPNVIVPAVE